MKLLAKRATPAAIAVLRQATALYPKRKKLSDGLLPSSAHIKQSPNSDHNTGLAVDLCAFIPFSVLASCVITALAKVAIFISSFYGLMFFTFS